jgi:hypothetical protein
MTRSRRLLAFALELLLLQVSILGGGVACASRSGGLIAARSSATAEHATHTVAHHGSAQSPSPTPDAPGTPASQHELAARHCLLGGSCAVIGVTSPALLVATVTTVSRVVDVADAHLRRSARPAPEPPPPRG